MQHPVAPRSAGEREPRGGGCDHLEFDAPRKRGNFASGAAASLADLDQGKETAEHVRLSVESGVAVYFCDPPSPWQPRQQREHQRCAALVLPQDLRLLQHYPGPAQCGRAPAQRSTAQDAGVRDARRYPRARRCADGLNSRPVFQRFRKSRPRDSSDALLYRLSYFGESWHKSAKCGSHHVGFGGPLIPPTPWRVVHPVWPIHCLISLRTSKACRRARQLLTSRAFRGTRAPGGWTGTG